MSTPTKRATHPWSPWRRLLRGLFVWPLDLDDGSGDGSPSAAKMIAWLFAGTVVVSVLEELPISGVQFGAMAMILAAAFGRGMYARWLSTHKSSVTASDTTTRAETVTRTILEQVQARRDPATGVEVSK